MLTRRATMRSEDGSMVIAITVLMVLMLLTLGVLTRTMGGETLVRRNQDFNGALAGADAGIADALYQLDQNVTGTFQKTNVAIGGGSTFSYRATQGTVTNTTDPDPNKYIIHASGTLNGVKHNVIVTAQRRQRFDYSLFANDILDLNGNCPAAFGPVGSAGVVITSSTNCTPKADCFLQPNGLPAPTSNGCGDSPAQFGGNSPNPNGRHIPETNIKPPFDEDLADALADPSLTNMGCPSSWSTGTITGNIVGSPNGYYLCDRAAGYTFSGTVTISSPPARIFFRTGRVTLADSVQVNGTTTSTANPASNIQLYIRDGNPDSNPMRLRQSATFIGAIYAPTAKFDFPPTGNNTFKGSLVARHIYVNGAPNLGYLDQSLQTITIESWKITDYHEVPSSCPLTSTSC